MSLREINRTGSRFTWTNKQLSPIRSILDRVFVSPSWEQNFPLCSLSAVTRVGSDHNPLLLDDGEQRRPARFIFQTWWLRVAGFKQMVKDKLDHCIHAMGPHRSSVDLWQCIARCLRQHLRGWGANLGKLRRQARVDLICQIQELDRIADSAGLDEEGWALRYFLEDQVVHLDGLEEEYWRQRSRPQWTLKGDSCTAYFHAFANGRRRKCMIPRLITDEGELTAQEDMMGHVYQFYHGLLGTEGEERAFSLAHNLWPDDKRVEEDENRALELTFTGDELDGVLAGMKQDSAPGPDGFPVLFFKMF
jgi:hypothetical protein